MIAPLVLVLARKRRRADHDLASADWRQSLALGLVWGIVPVRGAAGILVAIAVIAGFFLGIARERTGSILPGAIVHGLCDTLQQVPLFLNVV